MILNSLFMALFLDVFCVTILLFPTLRDQQSLINEFFYSMFLSKASVQSGHTNVFLISLLACPVYYYVHK